MNRVFDEALVPKVLFEQQGSVRRFTRLCAAFAGFYFDTENLLIAVWVFDREGKSAALRNRGLHKVEVTTLRRGQR